MKIEKGKMYWIDIKLAAWYDFILINRSCNTQIESRKRSEPIVAIGKSTRDKESKTRGIYACHMSKQPTRIRIEHPKIY